jgi:hypothetical protein
MKKLIIASLAAATIAMAVPSVQAEAAPGRGGCVGGIVGCCFGLRAAGDYNEGKALHLMEWGRLIPIFGIYVAVCNFLDGYNGTTSTDLQKQYGATYF